MHHGGNTKAEGESRGKRWRDRVCLLAKIGGLSGCLRLWPRYNFDYADITAELQWYRATRRSSRRTELYRRMNWSKSVLSRLPYEAVNERVYVSFRCFR